MPSEKSVIVVGGGIIGLFTAYYVAQKGLKVTIVERGGPDHDCCSLGNAGMIVPSHFVPLAAPGMVGLGLRMLLNPEGPFAIRPSLDKELIGWCLRFIRSANAGHVARSAPLLRDMHLMSRTCYETLASELDESFGLVQHGLLMICKTRHALDEETQLANEAYKLGIRAEVMNPAQIARLDPKITVDAAGAVYYAQDCNLNPNRLVAALVKTLPRVGVEFHWDSEVIGWTSGAAGIKTIVTRCGEYRADEY